MMGYVMVWLVMEKRRAPEHGTKKEIQKNVVLIILFHRRTAAVSSGDHAPPLPALVDQGHVRARAPKRRVAVLSARLPMNRNPAM